ncbi:MAG TPA: bifunctional 4-hydroxy-2-oxoglutarate aldolase/2-dehydro-3-deoxy-phosphogluconate aldolase [Verrucomicrobiota bacterium]|nr:bifunctional 4-hydroxy-2-oxoglutarate aldolase/2-dehydro-3-deoxy-phosphogluconate aldolase [Verrucomicrobiota bacterium]
MLSSDLESKICDLGIVPVVVIDSPALAPLLAEALTAGGLPIVEVTFRTAAAAESIAVLTRTRPDLLIGAGTVLTAQQLDEAVRAGARFCVAPGFNLNVVKAAEQRAIPFIPGVATPTEIEAAMDAGCKLLKFFPSEALGGVSMIQAIYAPYQHSGLRFVPTGGINLDNLEAYFRCKAVAGVGGTWIARKEDISSGNWLAIKQRCIQARSIFLKARSPEQ